MTTFYNALYTIYNVAVANWTNLAKQLEIMEEGANRSHSPEIGMEIKEDLGASIETLANGKMAWEYQSGSVLAWLTNETDRELAILDLVALYEASTDKGYVSRITRKPHVDAPWELELQIKRQS